MIPSHAINWRGCWKRSRSPSSASIPTAVVNCTPRIARATEHRWKKSPTHYIFTERHLKACALCQSILDGVSMLFKCKLLPVVGKEQLAYPPSMGRPPISTTCVTHAMREKK